MANEEPEQRKTYSTWNGSEDTLREFVWQCNSCTRAISLCRADQRYLITAFDHLHAAVRTLSGYCEDKLRAELHNRDKALRDKINDYATGDEWMRADNFIAYFNEVDDFFSRVVEIAVDKKLYAPKGSEQTITDIQNSMKQR